MPPLPALHCNRYRELQWHSLQLRRRSKSQTMIPSIAILPQVPSRRDLLKTRHGWTLVRNELERELEIQREHRNNYEQRSRVENGHQELKPVNGQRRKGEDDSEEDEGTEKRFSKRRNVDVDTEKRPSQPLSTSHQSHAPSQTTARPVYPHKFVLTDNGPWYESIYNEVYKKVYSEIYDETYSKAYNLAYNDAFKDG
ncbi:hypothetical protein GE21DRAFT_1331271 [Neurospora crassa]|nr:hypothetical protein GE21DRAFT_1331271 [Neurospora crassa]